MMRLDDLVKLIKMRLRLKNILTVVVFFGIWKIFILVVRDVHTTKNKKGGVQLRLQEDDNVDSLDLKLDKYESADRILHSKKNSYKEYKEINEEYNDEVFISDDEQKNKDLNEVLTKTEEEFVNIPLHQNFPDSGIINNLVAVNAPKAKYALKRADNLVLEDGEGIDQLIEGPGQKLGHHEVSLLKNTNETESALRNQKAGRQKINQVVEKSVLEMKAELANFVRKAKIDEIG